MISVTYPFTVHAAGINRNESAPIGVHSPVAPILLRQLGLDGSLGTLGVWVPLTLRAAGKCTHWQEDLCVNLLGGREYVVGSRWTTSDVLSLGNNEQWAEEGWGLPKLL